MIKCGHCLKEHETVAEVRACSSYGRVVAEAQEEAPATEKQINYAHALLARRVPASGPLRAAELVYGVVKASELVSNATKSECSAYIDVLLSSPVRLEALFREERTEPEDGIYFSPANGSIRKVYKGQSGRMLAKQLVWDEEDPAHTGHFEYLGAAYKYLNGFVKMPREEAQKFGRIYGFCCRCGRTLTDEQSIAEGIGPVCSGRWA